MKQILTNKQALELLIKDHKLDNCIIYEKLDLRELSLINQEEITFPMILENSEFKEIYATCIVFDEKFVLKNCIIDKFDVYASFFVKGLEVINNVFHKLVPFKHATHGVNGGLVVISGNTFNDFIDFEDTNFESDVVIKNNDFKKGTNLLTEMQLCVTFNKGSIIEGNKGDLQG